MPKSPPPKTPQLGEVTFGIRPNPFSKAQLIEAQLARIDMAQAEFFRNLKHEPADPAPLSGTDPESLSPASLEPEPKVSLPQSSSPGSTQTRVGRPAGVSPGEEMPRHARPRPPDGKVRKPQPHALSRGERSQAEPSSEAAGLQGLIEPSSPHYLGHRERLRNRFLKGGTEGLADYELLELILFRAMPRRDVKPLAKDLIGKFGSFAEVIAARPERLQETPGLGAAAITEIKIIEAAALRLAKSNIEKRPHMGSFTALVDYCRTAMAFLDHEEFRVLFLDKKNSLIADEVQGVGTVDHAPVYTREIIRRALELGASAIILVHNHPSGDPQPSTEDIYLTHQIIDIAKKLNVSVHDHLIIGKHGHTSLKGLKII